MVNFFNPKGVFIQMHLFFCYLLKFNEIYNEHLLGCRKSLFRVEGGFGQKNKENFIISDHQSHKTGFLKPLTRTIAMEKSLKNNKRIFWNYYIFAYLNI